MIPDFQILLIAIVFASQIFVLSFYTPIRWQQYHALLFKRYPREEYPRLHPLPREELERKFALFRPMHLIIGAGAILTLLGALIYADSLRGLAGLMQMCFFVQMLPLYIALPLAIRINKELRSMPPPSPRSAELRKWRVTDFISPLWIGLGIAVGVLSVACAVAVYLYRPDTQGIFITGVLNGVNLLAMSHALFGFGNAITTRADPYMSQTDTFRVRQRNYRGLFVGGPALGAWLTLSLLYNTGLVHFDLAYLFVISSVVFQLMGLVLVSRQNRDLQTRDFSVYRADGGIAVNLASRV
jgi:hypothetical protein